MDIFDATRLIFRWWFVTFPILLWAVVASFVLTSGLQPEYHAEGSVLFINPSVITATDGSGTETRVNPLLVGSSGLSTAAEVASYSINTPQVARVLESEGLSTDFIVGPLPNTPILLIEATGDTRAGATATISRVVELIEEDIDIRQADAGSPENQRVSVSVIDISVAGGADYGGRNRIRILAVALGAALSFGSAFLAEGIRRRRALRRTATDSDASDSDSSYLDDLDFGFDDSASLSSWDPTSAIVDRQDEDADRASEPHPVVSSQDPEVDQAEHQRVSDSSTTGNRSSSKA